jgi:hypothetical protein
MDNEFYQLIGSLLRACWERVGSLLEACWERVGSSNEIKIENLEFLLI